MKGSFPAIFLTASALSVLVAGGAVADETTVVHEQRTVVPDQPTPQVTTDDQSTQTSREQRAMVSSGTVHRRRATLHRVVHRRVAVHPAGATNPSSAAVSTSATVRSNEDQSYGAQRYDTQHDVDQPRDSATVLDRRTVIHRDDAGNVERDTRVIRQSPEGMTSVEHHSDQGSDVAP